MALRDDTIKIVEVPGLEGGILAVIRETKELSGIQPNGIFAFEPSDCGGGKDGGRGAAAF